MLRKLTWLVRRRQKQNELEEELRAHLEETAERYRAEGMTADEAGMAARRALGNLGLLQEQTREAWGWNIAEQLGQDARLSARMLWKNRGFTVAAVAMLAIGIGVNAAVFTVINAALFQGWPLVPANDRIAQISTTVNGVGRGLNYSDFEDWRAQAKSFDGMGLVRGVFVTLSGGGDAPEAYFTTQISANTFRLLGVAPMIGRDFTPADERPGAESVVLLTYDIWANRFGLNRAIIGQTVRIDGGPTTVIGVLPKGFSFPSPFHFALVMPLVPPSYAQTRGVSWGGGFAFARLADGATIENARAEMETLGRRLATAYPVTNRDVVPVVKTFEEWFIGREARTLYKGLWGAVAFVLLIVCANVSNLLVAKAMGRRHETAIRLALGAGRGRIVRQFAMESLLLTAVSGVIGWWIAKAFVQIYVAARVNEDVLNFTMDARVLAYLIAISLTTGLIAGVATATYLTKLNIHNTSKGDRSGLTAGKHGTRLSGLFVCTEMVLAVILLASAGVLSRSFLNVYRADVGANTQNVLTMDLYTPPERFSSPDAPLAFYREIGARLTAIPGVQSVGFGAAPTDQVLRVGYELAGTPVPEERLRPTVAEVVVSPGYFQTLETRMITGRDFNEFDRASSLPVAIVNQQFANRNWPGEVAVGKRLRLFGPGKKAPIWLTVVGVVLNIVQNDRTRQSFEPVVYLPDGQNGPAEFALVRTVGAPASLAAAVRREIYSIDPNLRVAALWTLDERMDWAYTFERNVAVLLLVFAVVALLLASIGLYSAVSHAVSRRTREIGIRVAVGATAGNIRRLVFGQGMLPVGIGLIIGLGGSLAVTRLLESQLVGVTPHDPVTFAASAAVLILAAILGCLLPARRAMRVDPVVALRED